MPLDKDILGAALYNRSLEWNNKTPEELGDLEAARLAFWKAMADEVIKHFKVHGTVPALGLTSPSGLVTGTAKIV